MERIEVSYSPSIDDLVAFNAFVTGSTPAIRQRILVTRVLGAVLAVLGVLLLLIWLLARETFPLLIGIAAIALGLFYTIDARGMVLRATSKLARRLYSQEPSGVLFEPRTLAISAEGIQETASLSTSTASWQTVTWVSEMESAALLWISPVHAYIVPRRAFPGDAEFREFLNLAEKYRASAALPAAS